MKPTKPKKTTNPRLPKIPKSMKVLTAVDKEGNPGDLSVLEEGGIAFDPTSQRVQLGAEGMRRTTALMMAINAYDKLIIKEAEMFLAICREQDRNPELPKIRPATIDAIIDAAIKFDLFISGSYETTNQARTIRLVEVEVPPETDPK